MKHAVVLGGGMIGATMAADMAASEGWRVTVCDARAEPLERLSGDSDVNTVQVNLSSAGAIARAVAEADVVINALPSGMGIAALEAVIAAGKSCVDITFAVEDPRRLSRAAAEANATVVVNCGIAPGLSNMICGYAVSQLERCEALTIYVGGLPVVRQKPFECKVGFAPSDLLEEYTRPARLMVGGEVVVREALSELEPLELPGVGSVEAFNTDGLRTLLDLPVPDMKEKTLRWPGHVELMRIFRDAGFFSLEPIQVGGDIVRPRDVTAALVFPQWTYEPGEADLTVMRVEARGGGRRLRWDLLDHYDPATDTRSMSRCTGFPATSVARMIGEGRFPLGPGVHAPETAAGEAGFLDAVLANLAARGVHCRFEALADE